MSDKFNPEDMPILSLNASGTTRYEASRFLDSPEAMAAYLAESMKADDTEGLIHALAEVAKAKGVNKVARDAGVNRESLYKVLKAGAKTRFDTIRKLMNAIGVELTVQPIAALAVASKAAAPRAGKPAVAVAKPAAKPAVKKPAVAAAKPAAKPAVKKPAVAVAKPAAKPAVKKTAVAAAKPAAKPAVKKPAVAVAKPAAKPAVKQPAVAAAKPAAPTPAASATPHSVPDTGNTNKVQGVDPDRLSTHS